MAFGMDTLEWCGYPTVKKIEDIYIRFDSVHERVALITAPDRTRLDSTQLAVELS